MRDLNAGELILVLNNALQLKEQLKRTGKNKELLKNKTMAMVFEKPSLRTRISFETGMTQLGGHAVYLAPTDIGMGKRETVQDTSKVISSMADFIMARTFRHEVIKELAFHAAVPVINGLSDLEHPCQVLADLLTIYEKKGTLKGLKICFIGDAENNVTHSLSLACAMMGMHFSCAFPKGYEMNKDIAAQSRDLAKNTQSVFMLTNNPILAVKEADVVITDTWISMGDEEQKSQRLIDLKPYQVNKVLMKLAKPDAIFMHCLPAYRGNEVTSEVIDGLQSVVFQEAENRLHAQKALILFLANAYEHV